MLKPNELLREVLRDVVEDLRAHPEGIAFNRLRALRSISEPTVRRAFRLLLRSKAPVSYDRLDNRWRLAPRHWRLPPELTPRADLEAEVSRYRGAS
jgi:hypothetical protein